MENVNLARLLEGLKDELKNDIQLILEQAPMEKSLEYVEETVYRRYRSFLENSTMGRGLAMTELMNARNSLKKYIEQECKNVRDDKVQKIMGAVDRAEARREDKYKWTSQEKNREEASLTVECMSDAENRSRISKLVYKVQEHMKDVRRTYKRDCYGHGSPVVVLASQEAIDMLDNQIDFEGITQNALYTSREIDKNTLSQILRRYEEYITLVQRITNREYGDTQISERDEFIANLRKGIEVNLYEANRMAQEEAEKRSKEQHKGLDISGIV